MEHIQSFIKGFNDGFILATFEQDTATTLLNIPQPSPYTMGLVGGIAEVQKEKTLIQEFDKIRSQSIDKTIQPER